MGTKDCPEFFLEAYSEITSFQFWPRNPEFPVPLPKQLRQGKPLNLSNQCRSPGSCKSSRIATNFLIDSMTRSTLNYQAYGPLFCTVKSLVMSSLACSLHLLPTMTHNLHRHHLSLPAITFNSILGSILLRNAQKPSSSSWIPGAMPKSWRRWQVYT